MPRKAAVLAASTATSVVTATRGRGKGTATKKVASTDLLVESNGHVEVTPCPICCEPRDATDMEFYPCPCGFQLCLFCYQKLKSQFTGQCPACRAAYDVDPEDCKRIILSRASETSKSSTPQSIPSSYKQQRELAYTQQPYSTSSSDILRAQPPPPPPREPIPPKQEPACNRKLQEFTQLRQDSPFTQLSPDSFSGLPSGATWATPHLSRSATQESEVPGDAGVDESAWPALSESLPAQSSTPIRQNSIPSRDVQLFRKLSCTPPPPQPPTPSEPSFSVLHTETSDPPTQPKFHTAQVTSVVSGIKRAVCVPLELPPNSPVEPVPEAAAVLPNVRAAVREGRITSTDGAHQLVTLLRQNEKSNRPSLLQAGRLPPGFADPAYRPLQSNHDDNKYVHLPQTIRLGGTVVDYPTDRSTLHSPFQHNSSSYSSTQHLLHASPVGTSANQASNFIAPTDDIVAPAGRSPWQSNGLPGLDLSGSLRSAVPFNVSAIWGTSQEPLEGSSSGNGLILEHPKPPPPGFSSFLQSKQSSGMNGYHPPLSPTPEPTRQWLSTQSTLGNGLGNGSFPSRYAPPGIGAVGSARPAAPPPYRPLDLQPCMKSDFPRAPGTKT